MINDNQTGRFFFVSLDSYSKPSNIPSIQQNSFPGNAPILIYIQLKKCHLFFRI